MEDNKNEEELAPDGLPKHFRIEWNQPFEISTGHLAGSHSSVSIPIDQGPSKKANIEASGSGGVVFKNIPIYKFKTANIRINDKNNWAHLRTKEDPRGDYIDIIFSDSSNIKHSHTGFSLSASIFLKLRNKGGVKIQATAKELKGVTEGYYLLTDSPTGRMVRLDFLTNEKTTEIEITNFNFV